MFFFEVAEANFLFQKVFEQMLMPDYPMKHNLIKKELSTFIYFE